MAFYMGLSNRYGLKHQSYNMDESNWYESIHSSYSTQNSVHNSNNIDTPMTVPVSPLFASHTIRDSDTEYSQRSESNQRHANLSSTDSLYSEHMQTPVPSDTSNKGHAQLYTPSSSSPLGPKSLHIHRPLYLSQQLSISEPTTTADQIQYSTQGETPSPVHTNNEECFSSNNQVSNFLPKNKPIAMKKKGSTTDAHVDFSSNQTHLAANHNTSSDGVGNELVESTANGSKDCSSYTPLNYSVARPLDCSVTKKKEKQKKPRKQKYQDETPEQREERLERNRNLALWRRANETPEQREERLERSRNLALFRRSNETPEQRAHRLMVGRERMKILRDNETEEEKTKRLQKGKMLQYQRRIREKLTETKEERKARLREARDRSRQRRAEETLEQRSERLRVTRDKLRLKRQNESPETRARRLKTVRDKKRKKYNQMSHEDKVIMRMKQQEKKEMKMSKSDADNKRKTRGKDVKYDTFEDDLEDVLLQLHAGQFQYLNIPQTTPNLLNQQKTNPVDMLVKQEIEEPQADDCQANIDIHQDVKPLARDLDKDLSVVADHGNTQSFSSDSECEDSCSNLSQNSASKPQLPIEKEQCLNDNSET